MKEKYDWINYYKEFAIKLLNYKNKRKELINIVKEVYKRADIKLPTLDTNNNIEDIDPFTVFGLFNKDLNSDNRIKIISEFAKIMQIKAKIPTSFKGVPTLYNQKATYYGFKNDRNVSDIDNLWKYFESALIYAKKPTVKNRNLFSKYFDIVMNIKNDARSKVTMCLFWIAPDFYISLDDRNAWYIYISNKIPKEFVDTLPDIREKKKRTGEYSDEIQVRISSNEYLEILSKVKKYLNSGASNFKNFIEMSEEAYNYSQLINKTPRINNGLLDKNIIISGVPGSGKSNYINNKLKDIKDYYKERVTFYPEYTYYDFVGQMVPDKSGGLVFQEGNFSRILRKALSDNINNYYLIIEELNRGNAEAIFGDILQLLDRDESGNSTYNIYNINLINHLNENSIEVENIYIPSNLIIYATINNSDQNVFNFDSAFSRRWEYKIMCCDPNTDNTDSTPEKLYLNGYIKGTSIKWNELRMKINNLIIDNKDEIYNAEEKRIGLYFISKNCLSKDKNIIDDENSNKFASKIFRYLYLNVFRNNVELIFVNSDNKTLEDYINLFKDNKDLNQILKIDVSSEK